MGQPNWFIGLLRMLFRFIDYVVYWLVGELYQLFIMISETGVFSPSTISEFAGRIYALLGIFMLFKVSFSLITYILNPDAMTDKSKGLGKLLTNFFVVLIGIVAVPYVFQAAYSLQAVVLEENVVGNLIMGNVGQNNKSAEDSRSYIENGGNMMAFTTLSAFVRLNSEVVDKECANAPFVRENGQYVLSDKCTSDTNSMNALNISVNDGGVVQDVLLQAYEENNVNLLTKTDLVLLKATDKDNNEAYLFDYTVIISTIAGGFLAWILLLFCIDIALRSVKLGFFQLIAPIPIISYIDPKGQDMFKKWLKECGKTYADLFIRLVAIYFVIYVISELDIIGGYYNVVTGEQVTEVTFENLMVKILIIFGALMFAKDLPKLLENLLGFKFSGDGFTLNPMKKLGSSPYAAGVVGAVGGAVGGLAANAWATRGNWKGKGFKQGMKNVSSILAGGGSAGFRGGYAGFTSGGKGSLFAGAAKGIKASSSARNLRDKGYGIKDKIGENLAELAGVKYAGGTTSKLKSDINQLQEKLNNAKRTEQSYSDVLARKIGESTGRDAAALRRLFNGEVARWDAKGNVAEYKVRSYEDYRMASAEQEAIRAGEDWSTMSDARKQLYVQTAEYNGMMLEEDFNTLSELYNERNKADIEGRQYQKEINDYQDDMNKFKDRNKK